MNDNKTNEPIASIDRKINDNIETYQFTHYFPSVNRFDPRSNFYRPYIDKKFPQYPLNMTGIRDVPVESTLYGIQQRIGQECDYALNIEPTTTLRTMIGTEPSQSDAYWISQFGVAEDFPIQSFAINQNTHALNNDEPPAEF